MIVSREELDGIRLITNRIDCTNQMMKTVPEGLDPITLQMYCDNVIEARSAATFLQQDWWNNIIESYGVSRNCKIDFQTGELTDSA